MLPSAEQMENIPLYHRLICMESLLPLFGQCGNLGIAREIAGARLLERGDGAHEPANARADDKSPGC